MSSGQRQKTPRQGHASLLDLALPALLAVLVYLPSLSGGFVWDDTWFVKQNHFLRDFRYVPSYFTSKDTFSVGDPRPANIYRPLRNITYLVDYEIFGLSPFGFHCQNILWHAACTVTLCLVLNRLLGNRGATLAGGLLFAVHPVLTESVAWIKSRDVLLCGTFSLAAFLWSLKWLESQARSAARFGIAVLCYVLALFSYLPAIGLVVPVAAHGLLARRSLPAGARRRTVLMLLTLTILGAAYLMVRHAVLGRSSQSPYVVDGSPFATMVTMIPAALEYLRLLVFPWTLNVDYASFPHAHGLLEVRVITALLALLAILAGVLFLVRRGQAVVGVAAAWIAGFLLPFANIVPMMQIMAERFLYIPCAGFALLAAHLWQRLAARRRRAAVAIAVVVLASFSVRTLARVSIWSGDELRLFEASYRADPGNARMHRNYGIALANDGQFLRARAVLEDYLAQHGAESKVLATLGWCYARTGRVADALKTFDRVMRDYPAQREAYRYAALVAAQNRMFDQALLTIAAARQRLGPWPELEFTAALVLHDAGRIDEAEASYQALLRSAEPVDRIQVLSNLAAIADQRGHAAEAAAYRREVLRLDPHNSAAQRALAAQRAP
ncbi:MAG: hypothetical protein U1E76_10460 [Planctomycetota bacterium]